MRLPKGYHRLRKGTRIKQGDMFYSVSREKWIKMVNVGPFTGLTVNLLTCVRKMNQPKRKK